MTPFEAVYGFEAEVPSLILPDRLAGFELDLERLDEPTKQAEVVEHFMALREHLSKQLVS
jgi:hypothetical protein